MFLPNAKGMINKPTKISLTARLTIRIFDAVCNFLTRHTARITTRFPTIVAIVINEQTIITMIRTAVFAAV